MVARSREMASAAGAPAALAARLPRARGCRGARRGVRRVRVSAESPGGRKELSRPSPPEKFMRFKVRKTLRVPVPEPARVNEAAGRAPRSLERWIQRPENVMEVVFSKEGVIPQESGEWRISVIKLPFLEWELNPEFDLRVLPKDAAAREFGVRMVSDALRFAPEGGLEKLPPGFAGMDIWSYIDCELFIERLADDDDGGDGGGARSRTAVCADIDLLIAADIPGVFRWIPFFEGIGESAIAGSIESVGEFAQANVQAAYEQWVGADEAATETSGAPFGEINLAKREQRAR